MNYARFLVALAGLCILMVPAFSMHDNENPMMGQMGKDDQQTICGIHNQMGMEGKQMMMDRQKSAEKSKDSKIVCVAVAMCQKLGQDGKHKMIDRQKSEMGCQKPEMGMEGKQMMMDRQKSEMGCQKPEMGMEGKQMMMDHQKSAEKGKDSKIVCVAVCQKLGQDGKHKMIDRQRSEMGRDEEMSGGCDSKSPFEMKQDGGLHDFGFNKEMRMR